MRKVALVFLLAIVAPSLALAWLALRSLRDQQFVLERQEMLLGQGVADTIANDLLGQLTALQRDFARQVEESLGKGEPSDLAPRFDDLLRGRWTNAVVGFAVALDGNMLCPSLPGSTDARRFRLDNDQFLCSKESVEVVWNSPKGRINLTELDVAAKAQVGKSVFATKNAPDTAATPAAGQFREIVGNSSDGTLARFLQNQLHLLLWHRSPRDLKYVFGAEVRLDTLAAQLRPLVRVDPSLSGQLVARLRDDRGRAIASSDGHAGAGTQQHPVAFAALGDTLPHWEVAVFLVNPQRVNEAATTVRATLGLLVAVLVLAIAVGSWLIVADLRRQLRLARQKTDFVSNVSHELKTPLTSIRMFAEMLAEGRVASPDKQRHFLNIITSETARLSRLINNVLDFARRERGEQQHQAVPCDLAELTRATIAGYRPHLEAAGFHLESELPEVPVPLLGDGDALAQVLVNLLSNAEKYSGDRKEIKVRLTVVPPFADASAEVKAGGFAELVVLDRGTGVPRGCEERIFEQFFRAHDSLSSGISGSGLGLTLARQIARAHGGDVSHSPRAGGGSEFRLRLPLTKP